MNENKLISIIYNFITSHQELSISENFELGMQTNNWEQGERYLVYDNNKNYLFYFKNDEVVGIFDRTCENIKIF